jgi:hypothetical protein
LVIGWLGGMVALADHAEDCRARGFGGPRTQHWLGDLD